MKPFIVLLISFVVSLFVLHLIHGHCEVEVAGRIAMSVMLGFTAMGHFLYTRGMAMMIPSLIPFKRLLVYATGIFEIAGAAGLHISPVRIFTSWALIIFFIIMLPANINAAIRKVDYQKGTYDGGGINYLWFRIPLQIVFILWVYYFGVHCLSGN